MKVGDLVKYRKCGTLGVITRTWDIPKINESHWYKYPNEVMLEVLWSDGKVSDTRCGRVETVSSNEIVRSKNVLDK